MRRNVDALKRVESPLFVLASKITHVTMSPLLMWVDGVRSPAPKLDESHEEPSTCKFMFQINGIDAAEKVVVRRRVAASAHGRFWH